MAEIEKESIQVPVPDPTKLTTEQIERVAKSERDYVIGEIKVLEIRLDAMDEATKVLSDTINRTPTDIDKAIKAIREVFLEKFKAVGKQFDVAEKIRFEQKQDSIIGLNAALSAQKEAVVEQNKSNTLAIGKSEKATTESIATLATLFKTTTDALQAQVNDMKEKQKLIEGTGIGLNKGWGLLVSGVGFIILILGFLATR